MLFEKNKHRFFKQTVFYINNHKSEKQFLLKKAVRFTMKTVINETFSSIHSIITAQFLRIQHSCSNLLKGFDYQISNSSENSCVVIECEFNHVKSFVRDRLKFAAIKS